MKPLTCTIALFLLGVNATAAEGPPALFHSLARELVDGHYLNTIHNNQKERDLAIDCSQVEPAAEDVLFQLYGVRFNCDCVGNNVACQSSGETCCGDTCMTVTDDMSFTSYGYPITEKVCQTFTGDSVLGEPLLAGTTRCVETEYCGMSACGCQASLGNQPCNSCTTCGDLPVGPAGLEFGVHDCSNIPGGDAISHECSDFDTLEEIEEWAFTNCSGAEAVATGFWVLAFFSIYFGL